MDKVQPLTRPITEMDALRLNYWLSKFIQEVAKCLKDPYPLKTLYQIVCCIRRLMVEKNPAIEFNPLDSSEKRCVNWCYCRGGPFDILKLKRDCLSVNIDPKWTFCGTSSKLEFRSCFRCTGCFQSNINIACRNTQNAARKYHSLLRITHNKIIHSLMNKGK